MASSSRYVTIVANAQAIDPAKVALLQATNATFEGIDLETDYTDEVLTVRAIANEGFLFQETPHGYYNDVEGVYKPIEFTQVTPAIYTTTIDMSDVPVDGGIGGIAWVHLYANAVMATSILNDFGTLNVFLPTGEQMLAIADKRYIRTTTYVNPQFDLGEFIPELNSLYINIPSSSTARLKLGPYDQQINLPVADDYIVETSCGTVFVPETFQNKSDYTEVEVELFAPFIGIVKLDAERVTNQTLQLIYRTNIMTGDSIMMLKRGNEILETEKCQVGYKVPYKYNDRYDISKLDINAEYMMGTTPYIVQWIPKSVTGDAFGVTDRQTVIIGNLSGYVELDHFDLTGIEATETELDEIFSQLKRGVIVNG